MERAVFRGTHLVGLGGRYGSGKDSVADTLVAACGFVKVNLSEPIVEMFSEVNPWVRVAPSGEAARPDTMLRFNDLVSRVGFTASKDVPDVRNGLQALAMSARKLFGHDIWMSSVADRIEAILDAGRSVVVSGVRFIEEIEMIRSLGGENFWVDRAGETPRTSHVTERAVEARDFSATIENSGTLEDLRRLVLAGATGYRPSSHSKREL